LAIPIAVYLPDRYVSIREKMSLIQTWYERDPPGALGWLREGLPSRERPSDFIRLVALADIAGRERGLSAALLDRLSSVNESLKVKNIKQLALQVNANTPDETMARVGKLVLVTGKVGDRRAIQLLQDTRRLAPKVTGDTEGGGGLVLVDEDLFARDPEMVVDWTLRQFGEINSLKTRMAENHISVAGAPLQSICTGQTDIEIQEPWATTPWNLDWDGYLPEVCLKPAEMFDLLKSHDGNRLLEYHITLIDKTEDIHSKSYEFSMNWLAKPCKNWLKN
jgi:hypothetical protein